MNARLKAAPRNPLTLNATSPFQLQLSLCHDIQAGLNTDLKGIDYSRLIDLVYPFRKTAAQGVMVTGTVWANPEANQG